MPGSPEQKRALRRRQAQTPAPALLLPKAHFNPQGDPGRKSKGRANTPRRALCSRSFPPPTLRGAARPGLPPCASTAQPRARHFTLPAQPRRAHRPPSPPLPSSPQPDPSPRGLPLTRPRRHPRHAARSEAAPRRRGRPIKRSSARGTAPPDPEGRAPPARPPRAPRRAATSGPGSRGPTGRSRDAVRAGRAVMEPRSPELRPPPQQRSRKVAVGA